MRDAAYLREQAKLSLEIARQLSDPVAAARVRLNAATFLAEAAAARVRLNAATFLAEAEEIEQQAKTASTPPIQSDGKKHRTQDHDQGGAPMARSSNPDQDIRAGYEKIEPELEDWRDKPPLSLDDLFSNPAVQERVGRLIARAMRHQSSPGAFQKT